MTRDTKLRKFGPVSDNIADLTAWRDHVKQHINWIDDHRADLKIYQGMRKLYLREFLKTSIRLQKAVVSHDTTAIQHDQTISMKKAA